MYTFKTLVSSRKDKSLYKKGFFVYLFGVFSSDSKMFHSYGDVTITEGLQAITFARHLWPLSIVGSLACHTTKWGICV